jgi:hypothetical protein
MAGIKLHGAIDVLVAQNHIHGNCRGLWLDWMAQGTRVTGNIFHDNQDDDLFVEVDHGPFLVDHNVFASPTTLLDVSQGGSYAHNLIGGRILFRPDRNRETPFHPAHSTAIAGLKRVVGGDDRFVNNIVSGPGGLAVYDSADQPVRMAGNVYLNGATPSKYEPEALVVAARVEPIRVESRHTGVYAIFEFEPSWVAARASRPLVTTDWLGASAVSGAAYEQPDGSPVRLDHDVRGQARHLANPAPGPFETPGKGVVEWKLW